MSLFDKWQTYGRGLLSLEVEQAMIRYISGERGEHTHAINPPENMQLSQGMKSRKPKLTYTLAELDQIRSSIKAADAYIDKKMKGLKIEANEKERVKAKILREDILAC
jgi:hypothetical protein